MRVAVIIDEMRFPYRGLAHSYVKSEGRFPQAILYALAEIPFIEELECRLRVPVVYEEQHIKFVGELTGRYDLVIDNCGINGYDRPNTEEYWCCFNAGIDEERFRHTIAYDLGLFMTNSIKEAFLQRGFKGSWAVVTPVCPSMNSSRISQIFFAPTAILHECNVLTVLYAFSKIYRQRFDTTLFICTHAFESVESDYHKAYREMARLLPIRTCSYLEYYDWLHEMARSTITIDLDLHASWFANYSLAQGTITVVREDHGFEFLDPDDLATISPTHHKKAEMDEIVKGDELSEIILGILDQPALNDRNEYLGEKYQAKYHPHHLVKQLSQLITERF